MKQFKGGVFFVLVVCSTMVYGEDSIETEAISTTAVEDIPVPIMTEAAPEALVPDTEAQAAARRAAEVMKVPVQRYHQCVQEVIADESEATEKRGLIDQRCQAQRDGVAEVLPEELQEFILLNMDRRIDAVLNALIDVGGVIADTEEDVVDVIEDLAVDAQ